MKKILRRTLITLVHGIGFIWLYFVLREMNWQEFFSLMSLFPTYKFVLGLSMLFIVYVMKSLRWYLINNSFHIKVSFSSTLVYNLLAGFLSVITPGRLGELAKIAFLKKQNNISYTRSISSVILDRIWDVMALSLMAVVSIVLLFSDFQITPLVTAIIIGFLILSLLVILIPSIVFKPLLFFTRKFKKIHLEIDNIFSLWSSSRIKFFIPSFLISIVTIFLLSLIPLIFASEVKGEVPLQASISAVSISNILSFIPITFAGFGTREYVFIQIWNLFSHPKEIALTLSTTQFICTYFGSLLFGGIIYIFRFRKIFSIKEIKKTDTTD